MYIVVLVCMYFDLKLLTDSRDTCNTIILQRIQVYVDVEYKNYKKYMLLVVLLIDTVEYTHLLQNLASCRISLNIHHLHSKEL